MESATATPYPPGEYAIVEIFGRICLTGRIAHVERFGASMLALEAIFRGQLLPPVFQSGASIYRLTPCTAEVAFARSSNSLWELPEAMRAALPPPLLAEATTALIEADARDSDDDGDDQE